MISRRSSSSMARGPDRPAGTRSWRAWRRTASPQPRRPSTWPRSAATSRPFARPSTRSPATRSSSAIRTAGWSSPARAHGRSDVLALVYAAGFVPDEGETAFGLLAPYPPSDAFNHLIPDPFPFVFIDPAFFPQVFCQDLSPKKAAELNAGQRPISLFAGEETVRARCVARRCRPGTRSRARTWSSIQTCRRSCRRGPDRRSSASTTRATPAGSPTTPSRFVKLIEQAVAATAPRLSRLDRHSRPSTPSNPTNGTKERQQ